MKRHWIAVLLLLGLMILAGCNGGSPQVLPTLAATAEETGLPTVTAEVTAAPTSAPLDRPTLPPTWTPSPIPSETPPPTLDATVQAQLAAPTLVVCGTFGIDREQSPTEHRPGTPLTVYWLPVGTAARYRISLISETGTELFSDYTLDTNYTFDTSGLERNRRYGWEVYPEDAQNQQMCFELGGELLPAP